MNGLNQILIDPLFQIKLLNKHVLCQSTELFLKEVSMGEATLLPGTDAYVGAIQILILF